MDGFMLLCCEYVPACQIGHPVLQGICRYVAPSSVRSLLVVQIIAWLFCMDLPPPWHGDLNKPEALHATHGH